MATHTRAGRLGPRLEAFSTLVSQWTGSTRGFALACLVVVVWGATGPAFRYSDTWQLVINTGTTIVTFLMVFLIQRSQNKEALALQLKLNEIIAALPGASNRMVDIEDLNEEELQALRKFYTRLSGNARKAASVTQSHSIAEADQRHAWKHAVRRRAQATLDGASD
jgi:low affinity Fe/Cu permease